MPRAICEAWPIDPTVRKSLSCPIPLWARYSKSSLDIIPVVETMTASSLMLPATVWMASSRLMVKGEGEDDCNW